MTRLFEADELFDHSVPSPPRPYTPPDTRNPIRAYNPRADRGAKHGKTSEFAKEYLRRLSDALDPPEPEDDSEEAMRYRMRARVAFLRQEPVVDPKTTQRLPGRSEELKAYFERIATLRSQDEIDSARIIGINKARLDRGLAPLTRLEALALHSAHPPFELSEYRDPSLEPTLGEHIEEKVVDAIQRKAADWAKETSLRSSQRQALLEKAKNWTERTVVHYVARGGKRSLLEEYARDAESEGKTVVRLSPVEKNRR